MKRNEVIVHEHKKGVRAVIYNKKPQAHSEPPKPRNPVAKNAGAAIGGGAAGAHKDAKKASQAVRGQKHKNAEIAEGGRYGSRNPDLMNPNDYDRYQQDQMDFDKRAFKRAELQHELGHEDDPDFERKFRQQQIDRDRGPWYLKVNGKILKVKGEPKVFDWKKGANNYALAVLKNKPDLQGKIFLTKKNEDDVAETTTGKVTASGPQGVEITNPASGVKTTLPAKMASALAPKDGAPNQYTLNPQAVSGGTSSENKPEGPKVGSEVTIPDETNEQNLTPSDSTSPIHGGHDDQEHDQIISLLKKLLHKGVDEMDNSPVSVQTGIKSDLGHMKKMAGL